VGHQFRPAVVVEMGKGAGVADAARPPARGQDVAVHVHRLLPHAAADACIDVAGAVDHARVPVPGQHLAGLLDVGIHAGGAGEGDEQEGVGHAVGPAVAPGLGHGAGAVVVVFD